MYHGETLVGAPGTADTPTFCNGHQFMGEIVEAGRDVRTLTAGNTAFAAANTLLISLAERW